AWGGGKKNGTLYLRDGDRFKPIVTTISNVRRQPSWPPFPVFADHDRFPNGGYLWQDANDDQRVQAGELTRILSGIPCPEAFNWVDDDLNLWNSWGLVYRPVRF